MNLGTTLVTSFLITLARPSTWALGLATFLLRGGIVLVLAPIVVIPSAVGLANVIAPAITELVFAGFSPTLVTLVVGTMSVAVLWLVVGGLVAAAAEAEGIGIVAADEDLLEALGTRRAAVPAPTTAGRVARILAVRLIAHLPTLLALAWGATRIVTVAYRELTVPSETVTPVVLRVARGAPEALILLLVTWLAGELIGALGARRIVLGDDGVPRALAGALRASVRRPARTLVLALVPLLGLIAVLAPSAAAAAVAWSATRIALTTGPGTLAVLAALALLLVLWIGGLALIAVMSAWRSATWTVEAAGTFGAVERTRPGDWNDDVESGTLADLRPRGVDQDSR